MNVHTWDSWDPWRWAWLKGCWQGYGQGEHSTNQEEAMMEHDGQSDSEMTRQKKMRENEERQERENQEYCLL